MQGAKALPPPEFLWLVPIPEPCHGKVGSYSHTVINHNACSILSHTYIMLGNNPCSVLLRCVRAPAPYCHSVFCIESHGTALDSLAVMAFRQSNIPWVCYNVTSVMTSQSFVPYCDDIRFMHFGTIIVCRGSVCARVHGEAL